MSSLARFQGMIQVVRFNPWSFLFGAIALACGGGVLINVRVASVGTGMLWVGWTGWGLALWWVCASLIAAHWVYDLSDWPQGKWLRRVVALGEPSRILNVHAGFDETSVRLRRWLPKTEIVVVDLFDSERLTEKSIHRARALRPSMPGTLAGKPGAWPVETGTADLVCLLLAAHEFRDPAERCAIFQEGCRVLTESPRSRVLLVEHVRDLANFIAFGPGFLHFHSARNWRIAWESAGLSAVDSWRITPFLRVWCLATADHGDVAHK